MDDDGHGTIKRGGSGNNYSFRLVMKIYVTETETKTKTKTKKMKRKRKLLFFLFWLLHQLWQLLKMKIEKDIEEEINDEEEHSYTHILFLCLYLAIQWQYVDQVLKVDTVKYKSQLYVPGLFQVSQIFILCKWRCDEALTINQIFLCCTSTDNEPWKWNVRSLLGGC